MKHYFHLTLNKIQHTCWMFYWTAAIVNKCNCCTFIFLQTTETCIHKLSLSLSLSHSHTHTHTDRHRTGVNAGMFWNKVFVLTTVCVCVWHSSPHTNPSPPSLVYSFEVQDSVIFCTAMPVNSSHCSSIYPCGLDLLEKATSRWIMLGSITCWETADTEPSQCHATRQY